jgi:predicted membrane chloride channel (bestrophin family)
MFSLLWTKLCCSSHISLLPIQSLSIARHISVFGWTLKGQLRQSDESDIVKTMLCPNDAAFVLMRRKPSVAIVQRLRQAVADLGSRNLLMNPQHNSLERALTELHNVITVCERIQASPIPSEYTAHASRLLMIYLFFLPLALGEASVLVTCLVGFAMLGLDEISHFLEEPFRLMPLHQLSKNSMLDVTDAMVLPPKALPREFGDQDHLLEVRKRPSYW